MVDDNVNRTNSVLAEHGGLRLEVAAQHAEQAKRIVAEVQSGKLALDDAPAEAPTEEIAEAQAPIWEFLATAAVFALASFQFARTIWFARTYNTGIEWDAVFALALALPVLYFIGALLLVFRSKWALPCFVIHLAANLDRPSCSRQTRRSSSIKSPAGYALRRSFIFACICGGAGDWGDAPTGGPFFTPANSPATMHLRIWSILNKKGLLII